MQRQPVLEISVRVDAAYGRIGSLRKRLQASRNPARRAWIRHLIHRNQRKLDSMLEPLVDQEDLKGALEPKKLPSTYEELKALAAKDYMDAYERAEKMSETRFITTGERVPPEELLIKPESYIKFEKALDDAYREKMRQVYGQWVEPKFFFVLPKVNRVNQLNVILITAVGAVSGWFMYPASVWGPIAVAAIAFALGAVIAATDRR